MMKNYIKIVLIGFTLYLFQTSGVIQAKIVPFFEENFKGTVLFAAPPPMPAAPSNDDCTNAIDLTVNNTCVFTSGTVDQSTESTSAAACNGLTSLTAYDVWYKFTAGANGQIITLKGSGSFDAVVLLMDGCGGTVSDCSDNTGFGGTEILPTTGLIAGNVYYIRVYHYGNALPTTPTFDICVSLPAPPPINDDCANAIPLNVDSSCVFVSGSVAGATQSGAPDTCGTFVSATAYDVWYKFTATATNNVIRVQGALSFDAVVILKDSCSGSVINCADNTFSGGIEIINDTNLTIGNTYYIRVHTYGAAIPSTPDFDICVSLPAPPPLYDNCSNAILLNVDSTCNFSLGTVDGATMSGPADTCNNYASVTAFDVWYKFVAGASGQTITVKGSASFDAVVSLRDSCSGPVIDCSDNTGSGGTERINNTSLIPGNTYYVRVYAYGSTFPSTPNFEICVALPPPIPVNDNCDSAFTLTAGPVCNYTQGTVAGSTESGPADSCNYTSTSAYDVWYKFVATTTTNTVTVEGGLSFDAVIILRDSCTGPVIGCSDVSGSGGTEIIYGSGLVVGNTYYVRVYAYGSVQPETPDFNICISVPPPPPANDDCSSAILLTAASTCSFTAGTVTGSTQSAASDSCQNYYSTAAYDVWYKFVAMANNQTITVKGSESFDAVVLLKDSCISLPLDCADITTTGGTEVINANDLIIGKTYYIRVYDFGAALPDSPGFDICLLDSGPVSTAGIEKGNNFVTVYPNPAANKVTIGLKQANSEIVSYKIVNVNGQVVAEGQFAPNNLQQDVDLTELTSGIYNIQVSLSDALVNKKIVVMNK
jgi:hypothetical protein